MRIPSRCGQGAGHLGRDQGRDQIVVGSEPAQRLGSPSSRTRRAGRRSGCRRASSTRPGDRRWRERRRRCDRRPGRSPGRGRRPGRRASAIAASSVLGYSGLATWPGTLGKSPSGVRWDSRMWTLAEARGPQHGGHRGLADAVQRRVDDREVAGVADRLAHDRGDVGVVDARARPSDRAVGQRLLQRLLGDLAIGGRLDALDDARDRRAG